MMQFYICKNKVNGLYWSNIHGWVSNNTYDMFLSTEVSEMNLPVDGEWVCLDWLA